MKVDLLIRGGKVVFPGERIREMDVAIHNENVVALLSPGQQVEAVRVLNATGKMVLPGVVDAHTHLTLGPEELGYETETRSAALGGTTTVLNYILDAGDSAQVMEREIAASEIRACVDYGLSPGIVTPAQLESLPQIIDQFGLLSFKLFMTFKGNEGARLNIPGNDDGFLFKLLKATASFPGAITCVHAENIELIWMLQSEVQRSGSESLTDYERSRPSYVEGEAARRVLYLAEKADSPVYIVHNTCREALDAVRWAKARRPGKVFAETCPQYLTLTCDNGPFPAGKVNPPLRHAEDVDALWEGIADGTIDVVASDHVPRRLESKEGGLWKASPGMPGVGTLLPIFLTEGTRRGLPVELLVKKVTFAPAAIFGLAPYKGFLYPGSCGDLTVVDPETPVELSAARLASYADYTPYEGQVTKYVPTYTVLRGKVVVEGGEYVGKPGVGSYIRRNRDPLPRTFL